MNQDYFNAKAEHWSEQHSTPLHIIDHLLNQADIAPGMNILDVGCGDGILSPYLSHRVGPDGRVVGIDAAAEMIKMARSHHSRLANVSYAVQDVEVPTEDPGRYDRIICYNMVPHLNHPTQSICRLIDTRLATSGRLLIAHGAGRDRINNRHAELQLKAHILPPAEAWSSLLRTLGLNVVALEDCDEYYFLLLSRPT